MAHSFLQPFSHEIDVFAAGTKPAEKIIVITVFAVYVAVIIGVTLYIRAETVIQYIGVALMGKGISTGAVIALVIGRGTCRIPTYSSFSCRM